MTRILKIDASTIREAAEIIRKGGVVAYPTDTVYGLGCDPFNHEAVDRLFKAKERAGGALPVLVESLEEAMEIGQFDENATRLARRHWPGPLTLVVPVKVRLPPQVTGSSDTVGLRVPHRKETLDLIEQSGGALVGTSANIAGNPSSKSAEEVLKELENRIDIVLDGGPATLGMESTIVKIDNGQVSILREKAIPREEIFNTLRLRPDQTQ